MNVATDSYGRRTVFQGDLLVSDTTDTEDGRKPQWLDIDIWRTEGGAFVVRKSIHYRMAHLRENCPRLDGFDTRPATPKDTFQCPSCNSDPDLVGRFAQESRIDVDVYRTPEELISSLKVDGKWTRLSRVLLADLSEQDERIDSLWNTVVVE